MVVAVRPLTLEQFASLPEEEPALEFIDGVVTQKASPKGQHSTLQASLIKAFDASGLPSKQARSFPELRFTFGGASFVPDVAVYRWERIPRDANGRIANDFFEPPDLAVEIASPGQSSNALVRRCLWYVAHGVAIALLIDPADESVLAFRPDGRVGAWHGEDLIEVDEILPDFKLTAEDLFASLRLPR